jgi:hypothetical protein
LAIFGGSLYSIVDGSGSARFRNPHILTEPSAWLLHGTMLIVFVILVGTIASVLGLRWQAWRAQMAGLAALVASGVIAAIVGEVAYGSVWGFPLADLVWCLDAGMLAVGFGSTALAILLGTPGCEIGVLREVATRFGRTPAPTPSEDAEAWPCILGLHALDDWERRRRCRPDDSQ